MSVFLLKEKVGKLQQIIKIKMQSQGNKYFGSRTKKIINEEKQEVKRNYIDHTTDVLFMLKKKKLFNLIWIGNEQ